MTSSLEQLSAKVTIGASGQVGTKILLPLDDNKIVTSTNMKNGTYTIAAQPAVPSRITVKHTAVGTADTLGIITILGTLPSGTVVSEVVTPLNGQTVSSVNEFSAITSLTGSGWIIDGGSQNDTLIIGTGAVVPESYYFNAISNRIVASANMKVGSYTIAAQPLVPSKITLTHTAGDTVDTLGTVTITGTDTNNALILETLTPVSGTTVTSTLTYKTIISVVGAGWVIDAVEGTNDTLVVGTAEVNVTSKYYISAIQVVAAAVVASQTAQSGYTVADLTKITSLPVGIYPTRLTSIGLTSGEAIAYLQAI